LQRDNKYFAFKMTETKALNNIMYRFYLYIFAPLSIFRFLLAGAAIFVEAVIIFVSASIIGKD